MRITYDRGIYIKPLELWLDALTPRDISFVSHAHFDHMRAHRRILCSPATAQLMRTRMPQSEHCEWLTPAFGEKLTLNNHTITLHPAGHVLGSAMIHITAPDGDTLLYTGDFKLRESLTSETPDPPRARQLIMETTYGLPRYQLPPTQQVLDHILHFCIEALEENHTPILFCYALGKAQEILSALHKKNIPTALHPQIADLAKDYTALGIPFPEFERLPTSAPTTKKSAPPLPTTSVILMPPNANGSRLLRAFRKRRTAMLTGWALDPGAIYRYQVDAAFPLSDHVDYPDLLRLVEIVRPEIVHTLHGHAAEFSADLRLRGITSWPLGSDTQTEFDALRPALAPAATTISPPTVAVPTEPTATFSQLALLARDIAEIPAKKEKIHRLAQFLSTLPDEELPHAARYLDARPFPRASGLRLQLGTAAIRSAACAAIPCTEAAFRSAYSQTRDLSRTLGSLIAKKTTPPQPATITHIADTLLRLAHANAPTARTDILTHLFARLHAADAALLTGIITGELRIGLRAGLVEDAIAASYYADPAQVRLAHLITGDLGLTAQLAARDALHTAAPTPLHPLQPMLATPLKDAQEALNRLTPPLWCETKYDGIRCQLHLHRGNAQLYSRDLNPIGHTFPDISRCAEKLPHTTLILDGELLAYRDGHPLPFAELQKLLGRRDRLAEDLFHTTRTPLAYILFDVLLAGERSFLHEPLSARRAWLEQQHWLPPLSLIPLHHANDIAQLEAHFAASLAQGGEGLMLKNPHSPYRPGRRGLDWFKFKKELATLDCVITAVEYGHGKRKHLLSDYTFAVRDGHHLRNIGKAYSGLTDDEIETLTQHLLANVIEKKGRQLHVRPDTVLEIAFNGIAPSTRHDSGLALRFPRIKRLRPDKTPAQADTLATAQALARR